MEGSQGEEKVLEVLWSPEKIAEYFGVSKRTVYSWIAEKRMIDPDKVIKIGNSVRVPRSEIVRMANIKKKDIVSMKKKAAPVQKAEPVQKATPII